VKQSIKISGLSYLLRPVCIEDAQFIIDIRLEDRERNRFIHAISPDVKLQETWISQYLLRDDDYYFIVENIMTGSAEGLIGFYNMENSKAEWGRWVIKKGSFAAIESLDLLCQVAFHKLKLKELYCRTIEDNIEAVSFHNSSGEKFRGVLENFLDFDDKKYNVVEHYITDAYYDSELKFNLQKKCQLIFNRNIKRLLGEFSFHHIGYACTDFEKEMHCFTLLGYRQKDSDFIDETQGVEGRFLIADNQPEIELLKNSENSTTLDYWIRNKIKVYHFAYTVKNFDEALKKFKNSKSIVARQPEISKYFGKRICFVMLPNMFLIELIEV